MVSTLGWVLGGGLVGGMGIGAATGMLQWIVLRQQVRQAGWWVLASAAGWAGGWAGLSCRCIWGNRSHVDVLTPQFAGV